MKVFISQSPNNSIDNLKREIELVKKEIEERYGESIAVAVRPVASKNVVIKLISACDGIWFGDKWNESADCVFEHNVAMVNGIKILHD